MGDGPYKGEKQCFEDLVKPGEILFYPKHYFHETQNLAMPTMTVTGTVVSKFNQYHNHHSSMHLC